MLKFVTVSCALLAVAVATNFEYLDNGIEYDVSPNMISPMPYLYHSGYSGNKVVKVESSPAIPAYTAMLLPEEAETEIVSSKVSFIASAAFYAISCAKDAVLFVIKNGLSLILGSGIALGICKLTPLCNTGDSVVELKREIQSFATPQRLARAAEMVEDALRKYHVQL